ncbi:hypothetical protein ACFFF5_06955 [Lederbergia wuyishanensis]|uniref:Lipoprotein n=1 Tax=Lederbergia wuyishanensis TaxID=1347903 RepID=A0ABU0D2I9_9BACI|nr:hypothetical protein [Lederbergia wuyishanensis]MCJ8007228.1 hypothetical protein [Lederbergia wuyishanensis]MDQ0342622.1 hypothetical protein [Lederbergia wuyishanensis]
MKKILLTMLSTVLFLGLAACSNLNKQGSNNVQNSNEQGEKVHKNDDVREIVWKQLSSEQKDWIDGDWKDGVVSKITLNENMMSGLDDKSYEGKEVYLIDFPTKSKSIPNNMIVYADVNTFDYIGNGLVD